jgi:hypothetical protein
MILRWALGSIAVRTKFDKADGSPLERNRGHSVRIDGLELCGGSSGQERR